MDDYEQIAKNNGWRYSAEHGGWIHDDERDGPNESDYVVMANAEEACWLHDLIF